MAMRNGSAARREQYAVAADQPVIEILHGGNLVRLDNLAADALTQIQLRLGRDLVQLPAPEFAAFGPGPYGHAGPHEPGFVRLQYRAALETQITGIAINNPASVRQMF